MAQTPKAALLTDEDRAYINSNFVTLAEACRGRGDSLEATRALIRARRLPHPAYVLDDGTEMVAPDYFALVDEAGGLPRLREHFDERYRRAATAHGIAPDAAELEEEWQNYLSGDYGVCLRRVTPETIFRKSWLVAQIEGMLAGSCAADARWRARLTALVDELDALEREFAPYDRRRWGPVSRDRLIDAVRDRYGLT